MAGVGQTQEHGLHRLVGGLDRDVRRDKSDRLGMSGAHGTKRRRQSHDGGERQRRGARYYSRSSIGHVRTH
jgi:hypothetical protein